MKEDIIFKAIGDIDDDLIEKADSCDEIISLKKRRKKLLWTCASISVLSISVFFIIILTNSKINIGIEDDKIYYSKYLLNEKQTLENIWDNGRLKVYSISKGKEDSSIKGQASFLAASQALTSENLRLKGLENLDIETVFGDYYVFAYEDYCKPVVYNLKTGWKYDLNKLLLRNNYHEPQFFYECALDEVKDQYPELLSSEANRQYIWYCTLFHAEINTSGVWEKMKSLFKDIDFSSLTDQYNWIVESGDLRYANITHYFADVVEGCVCRALEKIYNDDIYDDYLKLEIIWLDRRTGKIYYRKNLYGRYDEKLYCYDFEEGTERSIKVDPDLFRFSSGNYYETNGSKIFVTETRSHFNKNEYDLNMDIIIYYGSEAPIYDPHFYDSQYYKFGYSGEYFYSLDFNEQEEDLCKEDTIFGMGPFLLSNNEKILAYRYFNKDYHVGATTTIESYYNRINDTATETKWVFQSLKDGIEYSIILEGEFVRYASNDNVVIIRKGGKCHAYLLRLESIDQSEVDSNMKENDNEMSTEKFSVKKKMYELVATDITEKILSGEYSLYSHEYYDSYLEQGNLIRVDLFTGTQEVIFENVDSVTFSKGKGFAFLYSKAENCIYSFNIATLENCKILLDENFTNEANSSEYNSVSLIFNDDTCTLTVYYSSDNTLSSGYSNFYDKVIESVKKYEKYLEEKEDDTQPTEPITERIE